MNTRVIGKPGSRKRARLIATGMALQPVEVKHSPRPALVERLEGGGVTLIRAAVGTALQLWVLGRTRKFQRPCKLCRENVKVAERSWRPVNQSAINRADRVCLRCWPVEAEKVEPCQSSDGATTMGSAALDSAKSRS